MKKRILVPVDNTLVTQDVIKLADFWGQKPDTKLLFLHARSAEIQKLVDRGELINPKESFEQHLEFIFPMNLNNVHHIFIHIILIMR